MREQVVHKAAVEVVAAWTTQVLALLTQSTLRGDESDASSHTHEAVEAIAAEWIKRGLENASRLTTDVELPSVDATLEKEAEDVGAASGMRWLVETIRSVATDVANSAIQNAMSELDSYLAHTAHVPEESWPDAAEPQPFSHSTSELELTTPPFAQLEDEALPTPAQCRDDPDLSSPAPPPNPSNTSSSINDDSRVQAASAVAHGFVASIVGDAVHHHLFPIASATETSERNTPQAPSDRLPQFRPEQAPRTLPSEPPLPSDERPESVAELATVQSGSRRVKKKQAPATTTDTNVSAPMAPPKPTNHAKRTTAKKSESPRSTSNGREDLQSPPRLRKLEEYLELHPVDRAKKVYALQPRPPPSLAPQRLLNTRHPPNGYDAEEESDDSGDNAHAHVHVPLLPRVKLAPLRGPGAQPRLASKSPVAVAVVDRPDRLGLLTKPKKRSGFCQQCVLEGRPCKVSDCLKHQILR